ncbi:RNA-guided endonuclease IscB [Streptomyces scopuliridis]|uniref:RNA-guided endonuclease IscB n=1 Tax=Streptomyces scopuliridis TaxID=452529 RepID=UPI0036942452
MPAETGNGDVPTRAAPYGGGTDANRVFVLARGGQPLMPCHPARARELLTRGRAVVARQMPFTIRLRDRALEASEVDGVQLRVDPGSKGTGIALTEERRQAGTDGETRTVRRGLVSIELRHRGEKIRDCLLRRAGYRRRRRSANLRYRAPRSLNRAKRAGRLAPSLRHRVDTTLSVASRLCRYAPVTEIHVERVAFDTRAMDTTRYGDGHGSGLECTRESLIGAEIRAYLLATHGRACAYCGASGVRLNIDHIRPRGRGGSSRVSNLTLACVTCNQTKGVRPVEEFLAHDPARLATVLEQLKAPLSDAAAMNATRRQLGEDLGSLQKPVRAWSGARTRWNRVAMGLAKSHTLDALAVGHLDHENGAAIVRVPAQVIVVTATGRGSYARTTPDRFGFPRLRRSRIKRHFGYGTGDLVRAVVPGGRWAGVWTGRVSVRANGQHRLTASGVRFDVSHRNLRMLQRADGYGYGLRPEAPHETPSLNSLESRRGPS